MQKFLVLAGIAPSESEPRPRLLLLSGWVVLNDLPHFGNKPRRQDHPHFDALSAGQVTENSLIPLFSELLRHGRVRTGGGSFVWKHVYTCEVSKIYGCMHKYHMLTCGWCC